MFLEIFSFIGEFWSLWLSHELVQEQLPIEKSLVAAATVLRQSTEDDMKYRFLL